MLTLLLALIVAHSHANPPGSESWDLARDLRTKLTRDQRVRVLSALAVGGTIESDELLGVRRRGDGMRVHVTGTDAWWAERGGRLQGTDRTTPTAVAFSLLFTDDELRGGTAWSDEGARLLLEEIDARGPHVSPTFQRVFWNTAVLREARASYVAKGRVTALAIYARGLTHSLRAESAMLYGRAEHFFGAAEAPNLNAWPNLIYESNYKTRIMNVMLTMIDRGLADGLDVDFARFKNDRAGRIKSLGQRVRQVAPLLRQIRDTPAFVEACTPRAANPTLCELKVALAPAIELFLLASRGWAGDDVLKAEPAVADQFVAQILTLARDIHHAVAHARYAEFPKASCDAIIRGSAT